MATVAVFVALAGGAFAASVAKRNAVTIVLPFPLIAGGGSPGAP